MAARSARGVVAVRPTTPRAQTFTTPPRPRPGVLLVGVDDTDSRRGGCTTALVPHLLAAFPDLAPGGPPRLVRLNPNVPWKTRGNGALALSFRDDPLRLVDLEGALARVGKVVEAVAERDAGTSPGWAVARHPPDAAFYDAAVTRIVERDEAEAALAAVGARWAGGRGVIGAAAALAWPAARATWERIAYRDPARIGTPREVDPPLLRRVEETFPSLFDTYDLVEDDVVCVPSSPCPVLWGLRGTVPEDLAGAGATLGPERPARETLFLTNQGTDDHLRPARAADVRPYASVLVRGRVAAPPVDRNSLVAVEVEDETGRVRAIAYPPTRSFRRLVARLAPGDDVTVAGGVHEGPDGRPTVGIEKLCIHATAPRKVGNPPCPACGKAMKSAGRDAGYRCRACGTRADRPRTEAAALAPGWHEVPASARRHLARPLKRPGAPEQG